MAIVENENTSAPIMQVEKAQSDNVRIMPVIPSVFALGFLALAVSMLVMPDVAKYVSDYSILSSSLLAVCSPFWVYWRSTRGGSYSD